MCLDISSPITNGDVPSTVSKCIVVYFPDRSGIVGSHVAIIVLRLARSLHSHLQPWVYKFRGVDSKNSMPTALASFGALIVAPVDVGAPVSHIGIKALLRELWSSTFLVAGKDTILLVFLRSLFQS